MNEKKLKAAISEAERFLSRAKELGKLLSEQEKKRIPGEIFYRDHFPKECGSVRRASMDLTRALSDLRRYD
ncbi:MAG: hypothetical protein GX465_16295 [Acidobacteria bacterium]|nr:hypothetical protein [Acidobacteriota bacterium]HRY62970.1 hypothetical protein [Candidatus Paceibacterota bacterium]